MRLRMGGWVAREGVVLTFLWHGMVRMEQRGFMNDLAPAGITPAFVPRWEGGGGNRRK